MIEVQGLEKKIGDRQILNDITFTVPKGKFLTVFGPNGAGKTTLIKTVAGVLRPTRGVVRIEGQDIEEDPVKVKERLGVISHQTFLYNGLTALENLTFYGRMYGVKNVTERAEEVLDQVGLSFFADDPVRIFSRGMQQRLAIARAIVHEPEVLLLDEPYTGLDQQASDILTSVLRRFKTEDRTVLMITHNFDQGLALSDYIMIIVRGRSALWSEASGYDAESLKRVYREALGG